MRFGMEKLEWCGEDIFIRFDTTHERDRHPHTDRQTDRQTPHGGINRAYASHRAAKIGILTQYLASSHTLRRPTAINTIVGRYPPIDQCLLKL